MPTVKHLVITGRVQGVGFRMYMERTARELGINGWVRNRRDGSVEAVFAGEDAVVHDMIAACRRGPYSARVDALDQREGSENDLKPRRSGELFSVLF